MVDPLPPDEPATTGAPKVAPRDTRCDALRSAIEALTAANQALLRKVEETGRINDDLQALVASIRLKDEFLAVMSHELRNPLNVIQLNVLMLERSKGARQDPDVQRAATTIATAVNSQLQIIDDLMDMSRLRTAKLALTLGRIDFGDVVLQIVEAVTPAAERRRQAMFFDAPAHPVVLRADRVRVEQIVWNLVNNAIKFTPEDGTISIVLETSGPLAKLTVTDNGFGLDAASIDSVFEMFRQAGTTAAGRGGLGIGLALVKQLAELHGGRVAVESPGLGQGASFSVWLPMAGSDAGPGDAPLDPAARPLSAASPPRPRS